MGKEIGAMVASEHEKAGVKIFANEKLVAVLGNEDGSVKGVELSSGKCVDADLVVMGTGVHPATEFLANTGIDMQGDGGITCSPFLQTNDSNIFAAGDIVSYPYWPNGKRTRTEHWNVALD